MQTDEPADQSDADARLRCPFDPDPKCYLTDAERGAPDAAGGAGDAHAD